MSVDVTKLPSGLTVITDSMPHLETAALGVWTRVGGRDEKPNEHGISHLLEHMAFKGTTRRSSREIVEEIEAVGGDLNAGTSTETTAYYARVMKADVPLALDVLSDILANPSFARKTSSCRRLVLRKIRPMTWCSSISTNCVTRTSRWAARCWGRQRP
jgi:predicted Zn-dependent peptidase